MGIRSRAAVRRSVDLQVECDRIRANPGVSDEEGCAPEGGLTPWRALRLKHEGEFM